MTSPPGKPFYSSVTIIVVLPLMIFFANEILASLFGVRTLDENKIDNIIHGLGGVSVYLSSAGVLWHLVRRKVIALQDENVFRFLVFGSLCFVVIGWELLEYLVYYPVYFLTYVDTICGLIGGVFTMLFLRRPILGKNSS